MKKILVVDDSTTVQFQLKRDLEENGYKVEQASSALEAFDKIKECNGAIDLLISDFHMTGMDGLTMIRTIRAAKTYSGPAFLLTTQVNRERREEARDLGVKAWIIKPYVREKLL